MTGMHKSADMLLLEVARYLSVWAACCPLTSTRRTPSSLKTRSDVLYPLMEHLLGHRKSCQSQQTCLASMLSTYAA